MLGGKIEVVYNVVACFELQEFSSCRKVLLVKEDK